MRKSIAFNYSSFFVKLALVAGLILIPNTGLLAQDEAVGLDPATVRASVDSHLDTDGTVYGYVYVGGDLENITAEINAAISTLAQSNPDIAKIPPIADRLADVLGLLDIEAIGISSKKVDDFFLNKSFVSTPDGQTGLLALTGGEPARPTVPGVAPADSSIVAEQQVNLDALTTLAFNLADEIMGPIGRSMLDSALATGISGTDLKVADILKSGEIKVTLIGKTYPGETITLPGDENQEIPKFDLAITLDGLGWIVPRCEALLVETEMFAMQKTDSGIMQYILQSPLPPEFSGYAPLLAVDEEADTLIIATSPEYLSQILGKGLKLADDETYQNTANYLPKTCSSMVYIHPSFFESFGVFMDQAAAKDEKAAPIFNLIKEKFYEGRSPYAQMQINLPDGIQTLEVDHMSYKKAFSALLAVPAIMAASGAAMAEMKESCECRGSEEVEEISEIEVEDSWEEMEVESDFEALEDAE